MSMFHFQEKISIALEQMIFSKLKWTTEVSNKVKRTEAKWSWVDSKVNKKFLWKVKREFRSKLHCRAATKSKSNKRKSNQQIAQQKIRQQFTCKLKEKSGFVFYSLTNVDLECCSTQKLSFSEVFHAGNGMYIFS